MLTENQLVLVEIEQFEGTDPTPTAASNFIAVSNINISPNLTYHDPAAQDGSLSPRPGVLGQKYMEISFDHEIQVDNSNQTIPPCDALLQACGWDDNEESTTPGKYYPASPRGLKCTRLAFDAGAAAISAGDTIVGEDSGASATVKAVTQQTNPGWGGTTTGVLYVDNITRTVGAADQTTGSGLSDLTMGGTYTGSADTTFLIQIDLAAATDTFKWKQDGGTWTTDVAMTGSAQTLADGVTVTFAATTGHTLADEWTVTCNNIYENDENLQVSSATKAVMNGTQWVPAVTIWAYQEDILWKITGAKGDVVFDWASGQLAMASFSMQGLYAKPVDDTFPTTWTDSGGAPLVTMGGTFAFGSKNPCVESISFGLHNTVTPMVCLGATHATDTIQITNRAPEITINPEVKQASDEDYWTPYEAVTQTAVSYGLTNSTVDVDLSAPKTEISNIAPGNRNGVDIYDITLRPIRSNSSSGEDEMYLQFKATP